MRVLIGLVLMGSWLGANSQVWAEMSAKDTRVLQSRFKPWIDSIRSQLEVPNAELNPGAIADALLKSPARTAAFHLQALGKLYADRDEGFEKLRDTFKSLEDSIGGYDKWNTILEIAKTRGAAKEELDELQDKKFEARQILALRLIDEKWVTTEGSTRLRKIEKFLDRYEWPSYSNDRDIVLKKLVDQLKKADEEKYDLSILEYGNGLHELRRDLRWFSIEFHALNGLIVFRPDSEGCPSPATEFAELVNGRSASSPFNQLPESPLEEEPCRISRCLFLGLSEAISGLGELKDKAEVENNIGASNDEVPPELRVKAEAIYAKVKRTRLLDLLRSEIKSCRHDD